MRSEISNSDFLLESRMNEYTNDFSIPRDDDDNDFNVNGNGNASPGDVTTFKRSSRMGGILQEFTKLYKEKLDRIPSQEEEDLKKKISVLECWVNDLGEQNNILVSTVEDLEREASRRVSLLQEELEKMAVVTKESCVSLRDHQVQVSSLMKQKVTAEEEVLSLQEKVLDLENTNGSLRRENSDLHQDLDNVLEVMSRGRLTGRWFCDDFAFNSLKPEQILGSSPQSAFRNLSSPTQKYFSIFQEKTQSEMSEVCRDSLSSTLSLDVDEAVSVPKLKSEIRNLRKTQLETHAILNQRDAHIAELQSELTNLHQKLTAAQVQVDNTTSTLQSLMDRGRHDSLEICRRDDMIRHLLSPTHHYRGESSKTEQSDFKTKLDVELQLSENIDTMAMRLADLEDECQKLRSQNDALKSSSHVFCSSLDTNSTSSLPPAHKVRNSDSQSSAKLTDKQIQTEKEGLSDGLDSTDLKTKKDLHIESLKTAKLENELSEKNILLRELQNHLIVSKEELRLKDETLYNIEQKLDSTRRKYEEKEERMLYLTSQLTNLQLEVSRLHGSTQQLSMQLDSKSELSLKLECENRSLVRQLNEKSSLFEKMEKDFNKLKEDIDWKKKETAEQKATISTLQEALDATNATCHKHRPPHYHSPESGSNLASNQSHPAFLHRDRMDSLSLKPDSRKDSASHLSTVLPDLRYLNTNTSPLCRNCPDVVSFSSRENSLSGEINLTSGRDFISPQGYDDILSYSDRKFSEAKSLTMSLPYLKSLDKTFQNESKSMTVLSPSDSGIGSEDFVSIPEMNYTKISGKRNGTFGKIFEI